MGSPSPLVVVVGMVREARIVSGERMTVLIGGGQPARLARDLKHAISAGADGLVSFGLCGALHPDLKVGDVIVESNDPDWIERLRAVIPDARSGRLLGVDLMVVSAEEKTRLFVDTGATAVDMESHILTACARNADLRYAIVRAVSDAADRALPSCVLAGMKPDGETNAIGVLAALARRPWELPALLRTAREAQLAFETLAGARAALGPTLGCPRLPSVV